MNLELKRKGIISLATNNYKLSVIHYVTHLVLSFYGNYSFGKFISVKLLDHTQVILILLYMTSSHMDKHKIIDNLLLWNLPIHLPCQYILDI